MASTVVNPNSDPNTSTYWERMRRSLPRVFMYAVLVGYAILSVLPLYVMLSSSIMKLGEVQTGQMRPNLSGEGIGAMFSSCILFTQDTYIDQQGDEVTNRRFIVDIAEEAADLAGPGVRATPVTYSERNEIFRLPFFTNYCMAWTDANMGEYIINTLIITTITIAGLLAFSPLAAYAFARMEFPGKNVLFGVMLATLMVPEMVTNLPNFLIVNELDGRLFGLEWYNNWPALTIPFMVSPFTIFLMRQQFSTIPMDLWDAARMDGAGHLRFLLTVVVPLSKSVLLVTVLFTFIGSWNALAWPILVTQGDEWRPISYGLQSFLSDAGNFQQLQMAGAVIAALPVLILYAFTQRYFVEGLSTSGLKG